MKETRSVSVLLLVVAVCAAGACGKRGAPLPPLVRMPSPVEGVTAMRVDNDVYVQFIVPKANVDGHTPADIGRVELYAITPDRPFVESDDPEDVRKLSTLVAGEVVRRPLPPLPPLKPGQPEPPPMPLPLGVDQGAMLVFKETLPANARTPVALEKLDVPEIRRRETDLDPLPGPLVAPLQEPDPTRYYYAVGISPSGRYGPIGAFIPVPLGTTSSVMSAPKLSYTEKALTIEWTAPPDARGVPAPVVTSEPVPVAPGETPKPPLPPIPATPVVPGPPPTTYDVYEVPGPTNATPPWPTGLSPAPIGGLVHTQPLKQEDFGVERCFFVRPVDILNGLHVRGAASPPACITLADTFEPAAPKSLAAVASSRAISLIWQANEEPDLAGYLVLRADTPGGTLTPLTPAPVSELTFQDRNVRPGTTYTYAIVAVDKAGNRSAESEAVQETARP